MKKLAVIFALLVGVGGCAGFVDVADQLAGIGNLSERTVEFDGSTEVQVTPAFLYGESSTSWGRQIMMGGRWNSAHPDLIILDLLKDSTVTGTAYSSIKGIDVRMDQQIFSYGTTGFTEYESSGYNTVSRDIYTQSKNSVFIEWSFFEKMLTNDDVRLRVYFDGSYEDSFFSQDRAASGQQTARLVLQKLYERVVELR